MHAVDKEEIERAIQAYAASEAGQRAQRELLRLFHESRQRTAANDRPRNFDLGFMALALCLLAMVQTVGAVFCVTCIWRLFRTQRRRTQDARQWQEFVDSQWAYSQMKRRLFT